MSQVTVRLQSQVFQIAPAGCNVPGEQDQRMTRLVHFKSVKWDHKLAVGQVTVTNYRTVGCPVPSVQVAPTGCNFPVEQDPRTARLVYFKISHKLAVGQVTVTNHQTVGYQVRSVQAVRIGCNYPIEQERGNAWYARS